MIRPPFFPGRTWLLLPLLLPLTLPAAIVQTDFNDIATGDLTGKGGGSGFSANWGGSNTNIDVVSGNLTSSQYSVTQFGTGQKIDGTSGTPNANFLSRPLTAPETGSVWVSFLAQQTSTTDRISFALNPTVNTNQADLDFIFVGGNEFRVRDSGTQIYSNPSLSLTTTYLVLAQISISGNAVTLNVYFNPSVTSVLAPASLTASYTTTITGLLTGNQISSIGVASYGGTTPDTGGQLDTVLMSNGSSNSTLGFLQTTRTTYFDNSNSSASYNWSAANAWGTTESSTSSQTWVNDRNAVISRPTAAIAIDSNSLSASSLEVRSGSTLTLGGIAGSSKQLTVAGVIKGNLTLDGSAMGSGETVSLVVAPTSAPLDGKITLQGTGAGRAVLQLNAGSSVDAGSKVAVNGNSRLRLNPGATGQTFTLGEISGNSSTAVVDDGTTAYTGTTILAIDQNTNTALLAAITKTSAGSGTFGLTKSGTGTLTLGGTNTYNGNTTITNGTLLLSTSGSLTFYIGAGGINNSLSGSAPGLLQLEGSWNFDLTGAATTAGSSWQIVQSAFLGQTTFAATFSINGFDDSAAPGLWTNGTYQFSELTGVLSVIPEPATPQLGLLGMVVIYLRRRRER